MHFFRNRNRPRSSFELQIGKTHLLEVTVHLATRRRDRAGRKPSNQEDEWDWYNANKDEIHREFLELMEASVLSRMFGTEIEEYHKKRHRYVLEDDEEKIRVGSKNRIKNTRGKRKAAAVSATTSKKHKTSAREGVEDDQKREKDVYFSFGELIQLAYKKEPIKGGKMSRTILFASNDEESKEGEDPVTNRTEFSDRQKLSHRLLIWISKSEAAEESAATSSCQQGMYRPEMIPISDLFRKPAELMTFSDDEEDD